MMSETHGQYTIELRLRPKDAPTCFDNVAFNSWFCGWTDESKAPMFTYEERCAKVYLTMLDARDTREVIKRFLRLKLYERSLLDVVLVIHQREEIAETLSVV